MVRESKKAGAKPEMGSPEQFYAEVIRQPSLAIEIPEYRKDDMEELRLIPLEYLYSLKQRHIGKRINPSHSQRKTVSENKK